MAKEVEKAGPHEKPKDAAPAPAPAPVDKTARICSEHDRAPAGLKRFKIRGLKVDRPIALYVLAENEAAAKALYLDHEKLTVDLDDKPVTLFCKELPD